MKTASNPDNPLEEICRQAAKVLAGEYWFPLSAQTKKLVDLLEEQKFLEPRGDNVTVGRALHEAPKNPTQLDLLHHSV